MIGMENKNCIQRFGENRIDLVLLTRNREAHVHEIFGVAYVIAWINEGLADGIFIRHRGDRRHLRDQSVRCNDPLARARDVCGVMIKG